MPRVDWNEKSEPTRVAALKRLKSALAHLGLWVLRTGLIVLLGSAFTAAGFGFIALFAMLRIVIVTFFVWLGWNHGIVEMAPSVLSHVSLATAFWSTTALFGLSVLFRTAQPQPSKTTPQVEAAG